MDIDVTLPVDSQIGYVDGKYVIAGKDYTILLSMDKETERQLFSCMDIMINDDETSSKDINRFREALTPSASTKAAYIAEFTFNVPEFDDAGSEYPRKVTVPWTTIKEIMKAIMNRATEKTQD